MKTNQAIPKTTISRLSLYLRQLEKLERESTSNIRSPELALQTGFTAAQVRKDLAYFGQFGVRGKGYEVSLLKKSISKTLGMHHSWATIIVGAGHLGQALSSYKGFKKEGFHVLALFDIDPKKIGQKKGIPPIHSLSKIKSFIKKNEVKIAILAVPTEAAQEAFDLVTKAGVRSILNFAPVEIPASKNIHIRNVDLATELTTLAYYSRIS